MSCSVNTEITHIPLDWRDSVMPALVTVLFSSPDSLSVTQKPWGDQSTWCFTSCLSLPLTWHQSLRLLALLFSTVPSWICCYNKISSAFRLWPFWIWSLLQIKCSNYQVNVFPDGDFSTLPSCLFYSWIFLMFISVASLQVPFCLLANSNVCLIILDEFLGIVLNMISSVNWFTLQ